MSPQLIATTRTAVYFPPESYQTDPAPNWSTRWPPPPHRQTEYQGIALEDYILAATARFHRCPLWTHNRKHYPMDDIELFATKE